MNWRSWPVTRRRCYLGPARSLQSSA